MRRIPFRYLQRLQLLVRGLSDGFENPHLLWLTAMTVEASSQTGGGTK
jgi:hypothetical protein